MGDPETPPPPPTFAHPAAIAVAATAVLVVATIVARQVPVPSWDARVTRWINRAPDWVAHAAFPVMQLGTVWGPIVVGLVIGIAKRDWLLGLATVVAGVAAWFVAKAVKDVVRRGRPPQYLNDIIIREGGGTGFGFVSGHAAVAAATAVVALAALPRRWRPVALVLAAIVGVARIVQGVHFAVDVVGGWALGTLLGLGAVLLVDRHRSTGTVLRRRPPP